MGSAEVVLERDDASGVERFQGIWRDWRTRPHAHPEYQLTWTMAGCGRCTYLGHQALLPLGALLVVHPGRAHAVAAAERGGAWQLRSLHVPARWLEPAGVPLLQPAPMPAAEAIGAAAAQVWATVGGAGQMAVLARLAAALTDRPGIEPAQDAGGLLVRRCLDHLAATLDRPVPLAELARLVRASPDRVRRAIAAATGLAPRDWHLQRRIAEAKRRLGRHEPPAAVAIATGFADQAHFTRHFTRLVHLTPARYARRATTAP